MESEIIVLGIKLGDWLKALAVILAGIGLLFTAIQQRIANGQRRAEIVSELLWKIYDNQCLSEIYYEIEYSKFKYENDFHGSDHEKKLDKLLTIFDMLAKKYYMGLLHNKDLELVSYEYLVIYQNPEINKYFSFLEGWCKQRKIQTVPFTSFRKLGALIESRHFKKAI